MKIIKQGKLPSTVKRFECDNCGCIWEAEKGEYESTPYMVIVHDGLKSYWMMCPTCKQYVDVE